MFPQGSKSREEGEGKKITMREKVQAHGGGNPPEQVQVSIFRVVWEGRDPCGAASCSTGCGMQKEGRCLQHLSYLENPCSL